MSGRRPKPTKLKLLAGNPGKKRLNANEADPKSTADCPDWLLGVAREEWLRVASELEALGLLSAIDSVALAAYCQSFARWRMAEDHLREHGLVTVSSKSGFEIQSPFVSIANTALDQMRKFLIEFGMSPSARSRVHATPAANAEDPFADFMERRNTF